MIHMSEFLTKPREHFDTFLIIAVVARSLRCGGRVLLIQHCAQAVRLNCFRQHAGTTMVA